VGESTIFVRLGGCDLRCGWCDSPHTWQPARECRIEEEAGSARFRTLPNPLALAEVEAALDALGAARHRFASLTGGEPLLQPEAVRAVARSARERGMQSFLETHGLCIDGLDAVLDEIDVVSMDWKLASEVQREGPRSAEPEQFHDAHARFLALAAARAETYVKVVVAPSTRDAELDAVCAGIREVAPQVLLVLQPVTPRGTVRERPDAERVLAWQRRCLETLEHVRVIPQTHPVYAAP
jgi:organic radical activating enzyme